ncbi:hypothetical protein HAX54_041786 [Datura stramonium]|uniref:Uncharacterized protein n=1 Tax=Datura stramonium TaxID=4076 RepID=A0ABS8SLB4_DATST|nr:hypothetical protein [Datura stramonium]
MKAAVEKKLEEGGCLNKTKSMKAPVVDMFQNLIKGQGWLGMPSRRVIDIGTRVPRRSIEVTGDIGYQPCFGVKWKRKSTITSERLPKIRGEKRIQTRFAAAAAINQSQNSITRKLYAPCK